MLVTLFLAAFVLNAQDETPNYEQIDQKKFEAFQALRSGRFTYLGTAKSSEAAATMKVEIFIDGPKRALLSSINGQLQRQLFELEDRTVTVMHGAEVYSDETPRDGSGRFRAKFKRDRVEELDAVEFNIDHVGPHVLFNRAYLPKLISKTTETIDGVECDKYVHYLKKKTSESTITQWFMKGTFLPYKLLFEGSSEESGEGFFEVKATVFEPNGKVPSENFVVDPAIYEGYSRMAMPQIDEDVIDAGIPSFHQIERLKFEQMRDLESGRFTYEVVYAGSDIENYEEKVSNVFRGSEELIRKWRDGAKLDGHGLFSGIAHRIDHTERTYLIWRPSDVTERADWEYPGEGYDGSGLNFNFGALGLLVHMREDEPMVLVSMGTETIDGDEYDWYEHQKFDPGVIVKLKQWFKPDTWLVYKLDLVASRGEEIFLDIKIVASDFDPNAAVEDEDLIIDDSEYEGYELVIPPAS